MVITIFVSIVVLLMMVYLNVLIYTVSLILISVVLLLKMCSFGELRTIIFILVIIVYVGAVMILVGYICAVCPNVDTSPSFTFYRLFLPLFFIFYVTEGKFLMLGFQKSDCLLDFFLRRWGVMVFVFLVFIIFLVLLIVTSQFIYPQGPLRSLGV